MLREIVRRLGYLGRRSGFEEEFDAEVRFHLETRSRIGAQRAIEGGGGGASPP